MANVKLADLLGMLGLETGASLEDVEAKIASMKARSAGVARGTPGVTTDGKITLTGLGLKCWVDDLDAIEAGLPALREFVDKGDDRIKTRAQGLEVLKGKREDRAARQAKAKAQK